MFELQNHIIPSPPQPADWPLGEKKWRVLWAVHVRLRDGDDLNTVTIGLSAGLANGPAGTACKLLAEQGWLAITGHGRSRRYALTDKGAAVIRQAVICDGGAAD